MHAPTKSKPISLKFLMLCNAKPLILFTLHFYLFSYFHSLSWLRCQRLAAARSRRGSDSPPDYHSLPHRHFATPKEEDIITTAPTLRYPRGGAHDQNKFHQNLCKTPQSRASRDSSPTGALRIVSTNFTYFCLPSVKLSA